MRCALTSVYCVYMPVLVRADVFACRCSCVPVFVRMGVYACAAVYVFVRALVCANIRDLHI